MSADHQAHGVSIADAARHLGISENAVRQRIKRGTLHAVKVDGVWRVTLEAVADHPIDYQGDLTDQEGRPPNDYEHRPSGDHEATTSRPGGSSVAPEQHDATSPTDQPGIAPLVELVADLTRQNADLAAAAALWQERARFLGERLAALEAGPVVVRPETPETPHAPEDAQNGPERADPPEMTSRSLDAAPVEPGSAQPAQTTGWRRVWRRILGHEG
jgi:hypothetical protein